MLSLSPVTTTLVEVKTECEEVLETEEVDQFQQYMYSSVPGDWMGFHLQFPAPFLQEEILSQSADLSGIVGPGSVKMKEEAAETPVKMQTAEEMLREVEARVEAEVDLMVMRSSEVPEGKEEDADEKVSSVAMKEEEKRLGILNAAEKDPESALVRFTKRYNTNRHEPYVMREDMRNDEKYVTMRLENTQRAREWRDARRVLDDKRVRAILHLTKKLQRLEMTIEKFEQLNKELLSNLLSLESRVLAAN